MVQVVSEVSFYLSPLNSSSLFRRVVASPFVTARRNTSIVDSYIHHVIWFGAYYSANMTNTMYCLRSLAHGKKDGPLHHNFFSCIS
jgi:hypothetical protein